ncbi:hypothetical protein CIPAW_06G118900 [Carya illinoinensis]|uniref:Uncharacterized protein n=1 Tax=Carya illinoinensis TaxID=32201 RepID=A0A8T1QAW3_CARIL|nr:hypothetical protein CIPAW_06G118900 [Carya illinoinensis]
MDRWVAWCASLSVYIWCTCACSILVEAIQVLQTSKGECMWVQASR